LKSPRLVRVRGIYDAQNRKVGTARADDDQVVLGDRVVPRVIEVEFDGVGGLPGVAFTIDSGDGSPKCDSMRFQRVEGGREVTDEDLAIAGRRRGEWIDAVVAGFADRLERTPDGEYRAIRVMDSAEVEQIRLTLDRQRHRRKMTPEFLQGVADDWHAAGEEKEWDGRRKNRAVEIANARGVTTRQAHRWIREARSRGFIPEEEDGSND